MMKMENEPLVPASSCFTKKNPKNKGGCRSSPSFLLDGTSTPNTGQFIFSRTAESSEHQLVHPVIVLLIIVSMRWFKELYWDALLMKYRAECHRCIDDIQMIILSSFMSMISYTGVNTDSPRDCINQSPSNGNALSHLGS